MRWVWRLFTSRGHTCYQSKSVVHLKFLFIVDESGVTVKNLDNCDLGRFVPSGSFSFWIPVTTTFTPIRLLHPVTTFIICSFYRAVAILQTPRLLCGPCLGHNYAMLVAYFIKSLSARGLPYWMQSGRGGHFAWPSRKCIPHKSGYTR